MSEYNKLCFGSKHAPQACMHAHMHIEVCEDTRISTTKPKQEKKRKERTISKRKEKKMFPCRL